MRFTSTVAGETLDDLTRRSYDLGDATSNDSIERARTALLDANPFLATLDSVPDGTVVTVPDLPGLDVSTETLSADQTAAAATADQLAGVVGLAARALLASIAGAVQDASGSLQEFNGPEIKKLAGADEQLSTALPQLIQAATARVEAGQQLEAYSTTAFAQFDKDLAGLRSAFG
jgi:phage tail protein X